MIAGVTASSALAATMTGTVRDPDGRTVPEATVRIEHPSGAAVTATTSTTGSFAVTDLAPGRYRVRALREGFRGEAVEATVSDAAPTDVALVLQVSAVAEAIVVSAAQTESPLSSSPASVTVLDADDLRTVQVESLADALRTVPGLSIARSGGRGALTSIFPRGGESDYTLVLVDGVRQNTLGGGYDTALLAAADVERVEVVQGPQSALFGPDAIGGVVQVVTRRGGPARAFGLIEAGGEATSRGAFATAGGRGAWSWGGAAGRAASDGFTGIAPGTGEPVTNDDFRQSQASASGGWARGGTTVRGGARWVSSERGFPGPFGADPNGTYAGVDRVSRGWNDNRSAALSLAHTASTGWRYRADATWADYEGRFRSIYSPETESLNETRRLTGRLQVDGSLATRVSWSAGAEALAERGSSSYVTSTAGEIVPIERSLIGGFGEVRADVTSRLFLSAGVRVDDIRRDALAGSDDPFAPRASLPGDQVVSANPRVAASWFAWRSDSPGPRGGWTRLRASAGTGIRPPDAFEIAFTDNPALAPERSRSVEAGVEQAFRGGAVIANATWFANRYDDLIVAVGPAFADASRYRTDNISNARARGLELSLRARPLPSVALRASYTWLDTKILSVDGAAGIAPAPFHVGDPLIRRPWHQGGLEAAFTRDRWQAFARVAARGRDLDLDPSYGAFGGTVWASGFVTADAGAAITVLRRVELFARVTNLLDARYEEALGFPAPGRLGMVGVRVAAGR